MCRCTIASSISTVVESSTYVLALLLGTDQQGDANEKQQQHVAALARPERHPCFRSTKLVNCLVLGVQILIPRHTRLACGDRRRMANL